MDIWLDQQRVAGIELHDYLTKRFVFQLQVVLL